MIDLFFHLLIDLVIAHFKGIICDLIVLLVNDDDSAEVLVLKAFHFFALN